MTPTRRAAVVALALLATLLVPAPGAAFHDPGAFLMPGPGDVVSGTIPVEVFHDDPDTDLVTFAIRWMEDGQVQEFPFDADEDGRALAEHGRTMEDQFIPGFWSGVLEMPPHHPPGTSWFLAYACQSGVGCDSEPFAEVEVHADGTPPQPLLKLPGGGMTVVDHGDEVPIEVEVPAEDTEGVDLFLQAMFHELVGKGLPLFDQQTHGLTLSRDINGDGERGDMSCAPTAAASSLRWFDTHGTPGMVIDGVSDRQLVEDLGKRAKTGDSGTAPAALIDGLKSYLKDRKLDDQFEVTGWTDVATDLDDIETELGRGQDVLIGLYWEQGGAHRVAVNDFTRNEDGTVDIQIMDPWTGAYETVHVDAAGNAKVVSSGAKLDIARMIHVSPKVVPIEEPLGAATPPAAGQGMALQQAGTYTFTLDTATLPAGEYLIRAEASDGTVTLSDLAVLHVRRELPGGHDGDPATTERIDATDPTELAVATSQARFPDGSAAHAVLSRDDAFPDSLAGSALTGDGPLLFTGTTSLTAATRAELRRVLGAGRTVYLLGGAGAIGQAVQDQLVADGFAVKRLSGPSRVETAVAVADEVRRLFPGVHPAALARAFGTAGSASAGWADAVTAGAWAAAKGVPILVTGSDALHPAVRDWLAAHPVSQTVLLGGPAALSNAIASSVPAPLRVHGAARDETASEVARQLWGIDENTPGRRFVLIDAHRDDGWALGLAAAGLAADAGAPMLVAGPAGGAAPQPTLTLVASCGAEQVDLLLAGSEAVIGTDRQAELDAVDGRAC